MIRVSQFNHCSTYDIVDGDMVLITASLKCRWEDKSLVVDEVADFCVKMDDVDLTDYTANFTREHYIEIMREALEKKAIQEGESW